MPQSPYDNLIAGVRTDLHIGGAWRPAADGARMAVIDPATEETITTVASATVEDARAAVEAAAAAGRSWATRKPRERAEILRKAFELVLRDGERLAKLMTLENGKSLADARAEVTYAAEFFRWSAEEAASHAVLDRFVDAGFSLVDTADVYSKWVTGNVGGESEAIIGSWVRKGGRRDQLLIATKVGGKKVKVRVVVPSFLGAGGKATVKLRFGSGALERLAGHSAAFRARASSASPWFSAMRACTWALVSDVCMSAWAWAAFSSCSLAAACFLRS